MGKLIRIGTRESQLAVWQAMLVKDLLAKNNFDAELVFIKSEGDIDLKTPLYEMNVQGIFTRSLDIALLANKIDIAVHSMKDVPTQLAFGLTQAAVLKRASYKDLLVYKGESDLIQNQLATAGSSSTKIPFTIATSSIRRKAQWLNRYPNHLVENLRGNVNTRLRKVQENDWNGAIFAAAGLERIQLRPEKSIELDWMLPAPAQGAIMVVCREEDEFSVSACLSFNDHDTALCTKIERDFLRALLGGCSTPISALAEINENRIAFKGNILSIDGSEKVEVEKTVTSNEGAELGTMAAAEILNNGAEKITREIHNAK
ncbi:MAG: hydroxymethylbilane synthase [Ferruginibacter sp.]